MLRADRTGCDTKPVLAFGFTSRGGFMPTDVVMPYLDRSILEAKIIRWLKRPGDKVQRDEPLFEISTDKVDAEIPAPSSGVLKEIKFAEGATVPVKTVIGVIDTFEYPPFSMPSPPWRTG